MTREAFLAEQAAARYPLFRSVDPIELATDDVVLSVLSTGRSTRS